MQEKSTIKIITVPLRTLQASALCPSHHLLEPLTKELFHRSLPPVQLQLLGKTLHVKYKVELVILFFGGGREGKINTNSFKYDFAPCKAQCPLIDISELTIH